MHPDLLLQYAQKMTDETGEPATPQEAEAEIIRVVLAAAKVYGSSYRFGYFEAEDIEQEAAAEGFKLLDKGKYDVSRPLAPYLHVHIRRRIQNLKRDHFMRPEAPCQCCDPFNPPSEPCVRWHRWNKRNTAKQSLAKAGTETPHHAPPCHAVFDQELAKEIDAWVDATFPPEIRSDYLRMKQGVTLEADRTAAVARPILRKFSEAYYANN